MADKVTNYQCPACTGPLHFDSTTGKLVCDYCGSAYEVADIEAQYAQKQQKADAAAASDEKKAAARRAKAAGENPVWSEAEASGLSSYSCTTCGAELVCDATTAATTCPYCGNPTVLGGKLSGKLKPEYILPFKMDKNAAIAQLTKYYKGKAFLPKAFKSQNHIAEIQGVYVPFWLFDAQVEGDMTFKTTRVHTRTTPKEYITETDHFLVHREGTLDFENVPVDGSSKIEDDLMESIEPFAMQDAIPFQTAYLAGYVADKYDVSAEDNILDGFTFRDLILAVHCNCENITPEAVRREAAEILEERMQDYRFLLRNNIEEIMAEAKKGRAQYE